MRILVTGGAGFIGSNLVHHLLHKAEAEHGIHIQRLVTLDKLTYAGNRASLAAAESDPRHTFIHGDVCDRTLLADLLRTHSINAILHLAAESHVDRSIDDPEEFVQTNFVGTYRLLETARRYWQESATVQPRFLHVSTDEVFGTLAPDAAPFSETSPYAPNSPYSATKAASDHLVRSYHRTYGLPTITANCSNNYGPYQFPEKLLPLMIRKTLRGEPLPVYGDGLQIRDWLYVEDNCRALTLALLHGTPGSTYLIGGHCEIRNIDLIRTLIETVRTLAPERVTQSADELITYVTDRPGHDRRYAIDSTRIRTELGWSPQETFTTGLRKTVQWYLDHEAWSHTIETANYHGQRLGIRP